ncbi:MAG: hypothetical protein ACLRXC_10530 [[Clostridium] leptum]
MASSGVTTINGPVSDSAAVTAALDMAQARHLGRPSPRRLPAASGTGAQMK